MNSTRQNLHIAALVVAILGTSYLMAMNPDVSGEHSPYIIQDINDLKPYYQAISQIRKTLFSVITQTDLFVYLDDFSSSYQDRTPKWLFLRTEVVQGKGEILSSLYTPFGEVGLLGRGTWPDLIQVSHKFLASMQWTIEDVTEKVRYYKYEQKTDRMKGPSRFKSENSDWNYTHNHVKLYLIKTVNDINLIQDDAELRGELVVFSHVTLNYSQFKREAAMFRVLSGGVEHF